MCLWLMAPAAGAQPPAQEPSAPQAISPEQVRAAVDRLGDLDYATRTDASRTIRRAVPAVAVPVLLAAVDAHADGYVRYRALVLLTGFNDPRTRDAMRGSLDSPNDRLRTVAYGYFEQNPEPAMASELLAALDKEQGEFVRPALVRAIAAAGAMDESVRPALLAQVTRGEDFFRGAVIEALGDYRATYAFDVVTSVAKLEGPLQDDAALALGRIGDKRALETLAALQRSAPRSAQPTIAAAICLLGVNCQTHQSFIADTLVFASTHTGFQELLRASAAALGALGLADHRDAADALFRIGIPSKDPTRAPVALALATIALRNTDLMTAILEGRPDRDDAIALMAEGFDMLAAEDLALERFFATVRRAYWDAQDGSARRALMQTLISRLDF
jgi:HEAT repeat protein